MAELCVHLKLCFCGKIIIRGLHSNIQLLANQVRCCIPTSMFVELYNGHYAQHCWPPKTAKPWRSCWRDGACYSVEHNKFVTWWQWLQCACLRRTATCECHNFFDPGQIKPATAFTLRIVVQTLCLEQLYGCTDVVYTCTLYTQILAPAWHQ